ncbi:MAG: HEPN domain-containing protein [Chloroflexota bacterium]|nr:HEPN domain-containing protein [Chloroflexota bacterium]
MTDRQEITSYLQKANESLDGAESELENRRFNNCANRCYYACFQAAIAALLAAGIQTRSPGGHWRHEQIQAQFIGQLINRRRLYPPTLRRALSENMRLRQTADYETSTISEIQAHRAVRRTREFVEAVRKEIGITP